MVRLRKKLQNSLPHFFFGLTLLLAAELGPPSAYAAKGESEYKAGQQAEARKDYDEALLQYEQALNADPTNVQYMVATKRVRFQAAALHVERGHTLQDQGRLQEALREYEIASAIDPSSPVAREEAARLRAQLQQPAPAAPEAEEQPTGVLPIEGALGPPQLQPLSREPINLQMTNDSKVVLETIGRLAGINVLFDPDYVSSRISIELTNVTLEEALDQLALLTKTFWRAVTHNTILVIPDTAVKRREQEQQIIKTFYLSNLISPQELTEVVTAIRTLLETRRIQQINSMNAIILRDTPDKVAIAEKIIRDIDKARPEVVVDVAVLEARRDKTRQLGLFPTSGGASGIQVPLTFTPGEGTMQSIPLSRVDNLSSSDYSVTLPGATLNALLSDSQTKILQRPEIRASDGQKATLRIGDRRPVATGSFQPGIGGAVVSPLIQTQFQFIDVGVNLDITPKVHVNREITLKVRVEISAVTQEVEIGGIRQPVIGQRVIEHDIRLREGEVNVLGGIFQTQSVETVSGIPGLSQIPLLRYLFSNVSNTIVEDEVLIVLRPHTVRFPQITALNQRALDVGREGDVRLRLVPAPVESSEESPTDTTDSPEPPGARLLLPQGNLTTQAGETFEVSVAVENAHNASSLPLEISYDPALMTLVKVAKGDFLAQDGLPVAVVERTEEGLGKTSVTLSRPPDSGAVSGKGTLLRLTFRALQPGACPLQVIPAPGSDQRETLHRLAPVQATVTIL